MPRSEPKNRKKIENVSLEIRKMSMLQASEEKAASRAGFADELRDV